ncbi:CoA transferase [Rhodococcus sp. B10]|uniref:CaiB/BaiF CoA-transferase family protein n=1 Tax=Rhodococcus sp. B10 TaxID=2695876 RepID=UPI001432004F|nr:CoA transferase [Rhodococcus sp. B10]NIL76246.1 Formyl-CoA:oxalate CoA-transferase [Rhodococcus sp. B10]
MSDNDIRVVELSGPFVRSAGRMLVGIGCDVVLVEPPEGDDTRRDLGGCTFAHWHAGKRSVVVETGTASGSTSLTTLLQWADIVLDGRQPGATPLPDVDGLVRVRVTPFGSDGVHSGWEGTDLTVAARGGAMAQVGDPDGPPLLLPEGQAEQLAGVNAAIGALLGLSARRRGHGGQDIDISAQECVAAALEAGTLAYLHEDRVPPRPGRVHPLVPHGLFDAADGHLGGGLGGSPRMWDNLVAWLTEMGVEEDLGDPKWADARTRKSGQQHIFDVLNRILSSWTKEEFAAAAQDHRLPWAAVDRPDETIRNPQLNDRDFFVDLERETGTVRDLGFGFAFPEGRRPTRLDVQALGADQQLLTSLPDVRLPAHSSEQAGPLALSGIRVLDLTWVLAGPYCTRILADHGAEVIKVESLGRPDPTRFAPFMHLSRDGGDDPNTSGYFNDVNRNKRSITLDTRSPEGLAVLRDLIATCDVVVENFSSSVMERMGLGYAELDSIRPGIVYTSMSGMGHTGPRKDWVSYADIVSASSGLTALTGWSVDDVVGVIYGHGDIVAGLQAALATLAALEHRSRTGRGQHIDLSQLEAMASHMGTSVVSANGAGITPTPIGNAHRLYAPHGVYRCLGADSWCAVAVRDHAEWAALCRVVGRTDWVDDPLLQTADARRARDKDIRDAVEAWTRVRPVAVVQDALQQAGVPAGAVQNGRDLVEHDVHLRDRQFYVPVDHPVAGTFLHEGTPIRMSSTRGGVRRPAPVLGSDTDDVLSTILGYTPDQIASLRSAQTLR